MTDATWTRPGGRVRRAGAALVCLVVVTVLAPEAWRTAVADALTPSPVAASPALAGLTGLTGSTDVGLNGRSPQAASVLGDRPGVEWGEQLARRDLAGARPRVDPTEWCRTQAAAEGWLDETTAGREVLQRCLDAYDRTVTGAGSASGG